jgi:hypothetical protein
VTSLLSKGDLLPLLTSRLVVHVGRWVILTGRIVVLIGRLIVLIGRLAVLIGRHVEGSLKGVKTIMGGEVDLFKGACEFSQLVDDLVGFI